MSLEANKALVRRQFEEVINQKNLSPIDTDMTADFVDHEASPNTPLGPEGVRQWINYLHSVVPDLHATIEDIVAENDKVVVRNTWRGTHTGPIFGLAPTGKPFVLKGMVMWRIQNGKIAERWAVLDQWGLRQQLSADA